MSKEKKERNVKIVKDIQGGLTYSEIGEKYNITIQRVSQFAKQNNVKRIDPPVNFRTPGSGQQL